MPFTLIKGRFVPTVGIPDGDSVRFQASNLKLWKKLEGKPVRLGTRNTVQLRFEGIDAIEKAAIQPLATQARDNMLSLIGATASNLEPEGYILARMTDDESRRPICFAYAGGTTRADGADTFLDGPLLRRSVNHKQMRDGFAYPLYYNTLFAELRNALTPAYLAARASKRGYWKTDRTNEGVTVTSHADLAAIPPIWPKLWRRLDEFLKTRRSLRGFRRWIEEEKPERVDILSQGAEKGLEDIIAVRGKRVRLTVRPEDIRVRAKAGER